MELNHEQKEILKHTIKNGIFCGGSKDMDGLVDFGLMEYVGRKTFVPDPYYNITPTGRKVNNRMQINLA